MVNELLEAASKFLLQSPPGEVNDVFNDCRTIVSDDAALEEGILPALSKYNMEQFIVVNLEGKNVLITEESKVAAVEGEEGERHLDPRSKKTFVFDHMRVAATSPSFIKTDSETESLRSSIDKLLESYVANHYNDGVCTVYSSRDSNFEEEFEETEVDDEDAVEEEEVPAAKEEPEMEPEITTEEKEVEAKEAGEGDGEKAEKEEPAEEPSETEATTEMETTPAPPTPKPKAKKIIRTPLPLRSRLFTLYLVGNKYNPQNYWTGRWRSIYKVDWVKGTLEGKCWINVHYYEQGNVQLSTTLTSSSTLSSTSPETLLAALKKSEIDFQNSLNETYSKLSDDSFKNLRRSLPKTRSKLDWNKISGYRLGGQLSGTKE